MSERVLVCGGRDYNNSRQFIATMTALAQAVEIECVIEGGADGADEMAATWAGLRGIPLVEFEADWGRHGRAAGPKRNSRMIAEGKPTLVVAFKGGRGTADMVRRARDAGVPVMEVKA